MQRFLVLGCFILSGTGVLAQNDTVPGNAEQLKEVLVLDDAVSANTTFKEQRIDADSLNASGRQTLAEALRQNTGAFVKSYGGNGVATLSLRGTNASHTKVFWNNLEIGSPMLGLTDLSTIPLNSFSQINLQYGFASLSGSSGALGGSLRLSDRPDFSGKSQVEMRQGLASFGRHQSALNLSFGDKRWHSQSGIYYYQAQNNFPYPDITEKGLPEKRMTNNGFAQKGVFQNIYYRLGKQKMLSLKTWYNYTNRDLPQPITGRAENSDQLKDEKIAAIAEYRAERDSSAFLLNTGLVQAQNTFRSGGDSTSGDNRFISWQNRLRHQWMLSEKLQAESGLSFVLESAHSRAYRAAAERQQWSAFTEWSYQFSEAWGSVLLLRQELIDGELTPLLGSLGFHFHSSKRSKWRFNLARNFRIPSLNDLYWWPGGNASLQPEKSWNFELGWNYSLKKSDYWQQSVGITAFYNLIDNWIQWAPEGNYWAPQNLKKVLNAGIELETKGQLNLGEYTLSLQGTYAYTRSQTTARYQGENITLNNQLPFIPFHKLALGLGLKKEAWELRYNQNYTSLYFTSADNLTYMPAYSIANISLLQNNLLNSSKHKLALAFRVNNLFDLPYQILPYRPEPGINFSVQLTYTFRV